MELKEYEISYWVKTVKKIMAIDMTEAASVAKRAMVGSKDGIKLHSIVEIKETPETAA